MLENNSQNINSRLSVPSICQKELIQRLYLFIVLHFLFEHGESNTNLGLSGGSSKLQNKIKTNKTPIIGVNTSHELELRQL